MVKKAMSIRIDQYGLAILTLGILCLTLMFYGWRIKSRSTATQLLIDISHYAFLYLFLTFLTASLSPPHPWQSIISNFALISSTWIWAPLFKFSYRFPKEIPFQRREGQIALFLILFLPLFYPTNALYSELTGGTNPLFHYYDMLLRITSFWPAIVLLRRLLYFDQGSRNRSMWQKIYQPQDRDTRATRAFAIVFFVSTLPSVFSILTHWVSFSYSFVRAFYIIVLTFLALLVAIVYVRYEAMAIPFPVKASAVPLFSSLFTLCLVGFTVTPYLIESYRPLELKRLQHSIHFRPNEVNGYHAVIEQKKFDKQLGHKLELDNQDFVRVPLDFEFPFYQQDETQLYVNDNGLITFEEKFKDYIEARPALWNNQYKAIAPLTIDLDSKAGGGLYIKQDRSKATITWSNVPLEGQSEKNTFQVVLWADGRIEFIYLDVSIEQLFDPSQNRFMTGITPGGHENVQLLNFSTEGYQGAAKTALIHSYYDDFRLYLHRALLPLAYLIIGSTLFIMALTYLLLELSLVKPLNALLDGIKQANAGALDIVVPVHTEDEIGSLTQSFNQMITSIKQSRDDLQEAKESLEERVILRTAELQEAKEAAEEAKEAAQLANRAKSTFLATMSHELRTPLNGILGYTQILKQTHPDQLNHLNIISQSGEHLLSLINDLLDLAKVESGEIELYSNLFHLSTFLSVVSQLIRVRAETKGLTFELQISPDLPTGIEVDERRLRQILLNLLGNAVKFTDKGHIRFNISLNKSQDKPRLHFLIEDSGSGIPADKIKIIFEPFKRANAVKEGTGLGLAITRNLVELMGGKLEVESQVGVGSVFRFDLPLHEVDYAYQTTIILPRQIIGVKDRTYKILAVDDGEQNRSVLFDLLSPLGFLVTLAKNGREGLTMAMQLQPDIIITDLVMPEMDGFELIRQIKSQPNLANTKLIVSSASVYEVDQRLAITTGGDAFVPKPIDTTRLLGELQRLLQFEWLYQENGDTTAEIEPIPSQLPPKHIINALLDLTLMGDLEELQEQLTALAQSDRSYSRFTSELLQLSHRFQLNQIEQRLKESLALGEDE